MNVMYALAAAFAAAGAASAQVIVPRLPAMSAPSISAPALQAPALSAPSVELPLMPSLLGTRILGVAAPGVTPAHIEAVKVMAEQSGTPVVIRGIRGAVLDLAVVGAPRDMWDGKDSYASIEDAVGLRHMVVAPAPGALPGALGVLQKNARPLRTDEQLAKLASTSRAPSDSFRFAVIGDAEPGRFWISRKVFGKPGVFWRLLAHADRSGSDFIFQMGDMVSRGTPSRFWAFLRKMFVVNPRTPYLTAIGNHDRHKPHGITNDRVYRAVFGGTNYSFTRGGWRFVVVDSSAGRVTKAQLEWLAGQLDPAVPTVVFTHIPPAPLSEWTDFGGVKGAGGFKEGSQAFMDLMSANKVSRVYMGHIHGLGVLERGGVKYVLTGGGGSPLFPGPVKVRLHHWLSVEAGPDGIVETVRADDGTSFPLR
jgi:hypothetical protein